MGPKRLAVTVIPGGKWPDSAAENLAYWLTRPPAERIAAAKRLRRRYWRVFHRQELPPMSRSARAFRPHQG